MPRKARKQSESGIYHVMLRGIDRQLIFERQGTVLCLDERQGTVNAKITEEKSKGAPKKGRKRFALSSRTKKCIPIVMEQE